MVWVKKITGSLYGVKTIYLKYKAGSDAIIIIRYILEIKSVATAWVGVRMT